MILCFCKPCKIYVPIVDQLSGPNSIYLLDFIYIQYMAQEINTHSFTYTLNINPYNLLRNRGHLPLLTLRSTEAVPSCSLSFQHPAA